MFAYPFHYENRNWKCHPYESRGLRRKNWIPAFAEMTNAASATVTNYLRLIKTQLAFTLLPRQGESGVPLVICAIREDGLHIQPLLFGLLQFFSVFSPKSAFFLFFLYILPFLLISLLTKFISASKMHALEQCFLEILTHRRMFASIYSQLYNNYAK